MHNFTAKYSEKIQGILSGFDRLIFRGSLRKIGYPAGLNTHLSANHVLLKDFGSHANEISERVKTAALRCVHESGRPIQYLQSSKDNKEEIARSIAQQDHIRGPRLRPDMRGAWHSIFIAMAKRSGWNCCNGRASACMYINTGSTRYSDGCMRASKPGFHFPFRSE